MGKQRKPAKPKEIMEDFLEEVDWVKFENKDEFVSWQCMLGCLCDLLTTPFLSPEAWKVTEVCMVLLQTL